MFTPLFERRDEVTPNVSLSDEQEQAAPSGTLRTRPNKANLYSSSSFVLSITFNLLHTKKMRRPNDKTLGWCDPCGVTSSLESGCICSKVLPTTNDAKAIKAEEPIRQIKAGFDEMDCMLADLPPIECPRPPPPGSSVLFCDAEAFWQRNLMRIKVRVAARAQLAMEEKAVAEDGRQKGSDGSATQVQATAAAKPVSEHAQLGLRCQPSTQLPTTQSIPHPPTGKPLSRLHADFSTQAPHQFARKRPAPASPETQAASEYSQVSGHTYHPYRGELGSIDTHNAIMEDLGLGCSEVQTPDYTDLYIQELSTRAHLETEVASLECEKQDMKLENKSLAEAFQSTVQDACNTSMEYCRANQDSSDALFAFLKTCMEQINGKTDRIEDLRLECDEWKEACKELKRETAALKEMHKRTSEDTAAQQEDVDCVSDEQMLCG